MTMASIEVLASPGSQARFVGTPTKKPTSLLKKPTKSSTPPIMTSPTRCLVDSRPPTSTLDIPRLIPEVKETSVIMSGLLEAYGLPTPSGTAANELTALGRPRPQRNPIGTTNNITGGNNRLIKNAQSGTTGQKVIVAVYQTSREHFAVVYPLRMMISARQPITSINLRQAVVIETGPDTFRVESTKERKNGNQSSLSFKLLKNSTVDLKCWLDAFGHQTSPVAESSCLSRSPVMSSYTPVMATLDETDDDEENETQDNK